MMSMAETVYNIREMQLQTLQGGSGGSSSGSLTLERAETIVHDVLSDMPADQWATLYPIEAIQYGSNLISISEGDSIRSDYQLQRFTELLGALKRGEDLGVLFETYPDVVATGAYDLIQLNRWMQTKIFPS